MDEDELAALEAELEEEEKTSKKTQKHQGNKPDFKKHDSGKKPNNN